MVSSRSLIWTMMTCLMLASCRGFASDTPIPDQASKETSLPDTPTPAPEYVTRLRNAEYQLGFLDSLRVVKLTNGKYESDIAGDEFVAVTMTDFTTRGDFNGDGLNEYAALVAENYGGSGVFVFLAVYSEVDGQLVFQTSSWVADRPQVNGLSMDERGIFLDATVHRSDDPMCCPTMHTMRHYRMIQNQLDMTDYVTFTVDDRPRTITIETPKDGAQAFSSVRVKGNVAIAPFENNLVYRIFDIGGVELAIGSITVSAPEPGAPGTFDESILLGKILSGVVIRIEIQDISAEDGSLFAMDSVELVVK